MNIPELLRKYQSSFDWIKTTILTILFIFPYVSYSQDSIIRRNGEPIDCKITKVDSSIIYYDFKKGNRKLSSFIAKSDIQSYKISTIDSVKAQTFGQPQIQEHSVIIDTSKFEKETNKWISLLTYSQRYGLNAKGWSVQYCGFNYRSKSKRFVPVIFGIELFELDPDILLKNNYSYLKMNYYRVGIQPLYKLSDRLFFNYGIDLILGTEQLIEYWGESKFKMIVGLSPSQGIFFIPKSKFGITFGVGVYEKIISSKVYNIDFGAKFDVGIKF